MRNRKRLKKFLVGAFILFSLSIGPVSVHAQKLHISVFGGWSRVFESGSEADYRLGENDFPVTPAHTPAQVGAILGAFFSDHIGLELSYRYFFSSKITLVDPSDQDTVEVDSSKRYALTLNLVYRVLKGRVSPYVMVGGGLDKILAEDEIYSSEFGFEIEFLAPEKMTNGLINLGGGIYYLALRNLGVRLDVCYNLIFDDPNNQRSLEVAVGLTYSF